MRKALVSLILVLATVPTFAKEKAITTKGKTIELAVTDNGFEPSSINVAPGTTVTLNVTRKTDSTCARAIQVPSLNVKKDLPLNQTVAINLGKLNKGEIRFGCGMDMMVGGQIHVQ